VKFDTAKVLIEQVIYKPGWKFEVTDFSHRFEGTIMVKVTYPATNSDRDQAPCFSEQIEGGARASFGLACGDCNNPMDLYRTMLTDVIMPIELHEAREFFRIPPTNWAPYHPHNLTGMKEWGTPDQDRRFGMI